MDSIILLKRWGKTSKLGIICIVISLAYLVGTNILMVWTFLSAYGTESKSILITINEFNEANLEIVLISILTILSTISALLLVKNLKREYHAV